MNTLGDYRDRPHWSYSSLNQLLNLCSLQWMFEKIERLPRAFTPVSLVLGSVYRRVMENIALHRMEHRLPTEQDTLSMSSPEGIAAFPRRPIVPWAAACAAP
jgi:hypothetical protein